MKNLFLSISYKSRENPDFLPDYLKFLKYLALKYCPEEKIGELKDIFQNQDVNRFVIFLSEFQPNIKQDIADYIDKY